MHNIVFILCLIFLSESSQISNPENDADKLTHEMYNFFTEVLADNYEGQDEETLYSQFLIHYFNASVKSESYEPDRLRLVINGEKLRLINAELFKRDSLHYHHYYMEVLDLKDLDDYANNPKEFHLKYSNIPFVIHNYKDASPNDPYPVVPLAESQFVTINFNRGYFKELQKEDYEIIKYLKRWIELNGNSISFSGLAAFLTQTEDNSELRHKVVREIVAVIYWKLLCSQAGVDFHRN